MAHTPHRPLPDDARAGALTPIERSAISQGWRLRARNELSTSAVFANLTRSLIAFGAPHAIIRHAAAAVEDEVRHAEICIHVARTYEPECALPPSSVVSEPPRFGGSVELDARLFAVMQSCINEGIAAAYLQRCLAEATSPLARAAVRDILTDEIHHARLGWSLLASEGAEASRADVAEALPTLLRLVADSWQAAGAERPGDIPNGHGLIAAHAITEVVRTAFEVLVVPGFEAVGIDVRPARAWLGARHGDRWRSSLTDGPGY